MIVNATVETWMKRSGLLNVAARAHPIAAASVPAPSHPGTRRRTSSVAAIHITPTRPTTTPSSAKKRSHSLCGELRTASP